MVDQVLALTLCDIDIQKERSLLRIPNKSQAPNNCQPRFTRKTQAVSKNHRRLIEELLENGVILRRKQQRPPKKQAHN